jgi:GTPase SAR1 family protein
MYDVQSRISFDNLTKWIENMTSNSLDLNTMAVIIIGNKIDLPNGKTKQVSSNEGKSFADQYNVPFFEISVKDMTNMEEMFKTVCTDMYLKSSYPSKLFKSKYP